MQFFYRTCALGCTDQNVKLKTLLYVYIRRWVYVCTFQVLRASAGVKNACTWAKCMFWAPVQGTKRNHLAAAMLPPHKGLGGHYLYGYVFSVLYWLLMFCELVVWNFVKLIRSWQLWIARFLGNKWIVNYTTKYVSNGKTSSLCNVGINFYFFKRSKKLW